MGSLICYGGNVKALWLENKTLSFRSDLETPDISSDEALVRVRLAGICSTDLEMVRGYYPYTGIPGHEFVGEVVQSSSDEWVGTRVVGEINASCGECNACRAGRPTHCEYRTVLGIVNHDGAFAEYLRLPLTNLHQVPDAVPDQQAVFIEPLAAACEILEQVHIQPTDRVLVLGAGRLGLLIAQMLALTGCKLQVAVRSTHSRHAETRRMLLGWQIDVIDPEAIQTGMADVVIEVTGSPDGFSIAHKAIRPRGTLVMKSTYHGTLNVDFSSIVVDEITIVGSRCGPFGPALRLLETGKVDPLPLISAHYSLEDGLAAFEKAGRSGVLKVLLDL